MRSRPGGVECVFTSSRLYDGAQRCDRVAHLNHAVTQYHATSDSYDVQSRRLALQPRARGSIGRRCCGSPTSRVAHRFVSFTRSVHDIGDGLSDVLPTVRMGYRVAPSETTVIESPPFPARRRRTRCACSARRWRSRAPARRCRDGRTRSPPPDVNFMNGHRIKPPFPEGLALAQFGLGCFWGGRRRSGACPACIRPRSVCGRRHAEPHLRGGMQRAHRPQRGRPRRLRAGAHRLRRAPQGVLGSPRPHPGDAPGKRRRHAVPLGRLHVLRGAGRA